MAGATATAVSRIHTMSPTEVKAKIDRGEVTLVDVREPVEHADERIPGAKLMPLATLNPATLAREDGRTIVFHCKRGGRSAKAAQMLLNAGYPEAWHLEGGIDAWKAANLPIERDAKAPISVIRQVQITAGMIVLIGSLLGFFVSPWFFALSGFIGAGLVFAGVTDVCGMAMFLAKIPCNRR